MNERLLIVEDEETLCESLKRVLQRDGYEADTVNSAETALRNIEEVSYDLVISDILLPGIDGIELLRRIREKIPDQIVIIITAYASIETAVGALRAGAYDYVIKPIIHEEIKRIVKNALRERSLVAENVILRKQIEEKYDFEKIVGESKEITSLISEVKKIANSRSNVLLLGETGTGKELVARAVHYNSARLDKPFVPINCSAIPETLLESELFGYVKGAFTGAAGSKRGLFEEANGGTLFLDEIGELGQQLQAKLLRVIDDHQVRPLGGVQSRTVDVRIIAATNRDIIKAVQEGIFREDLYYRINVVTITLPPLRERKEDIPILARHFLEKYSQEIGKQVQFIDDVALRILMNYNWPGNVRELRNIIERAVLITDSNTIFPEHLPEMLKITNSFLTEAFNNTLSIEDYTKEFILKYQSSYPEQKLADMLGITRKSLWEKRKRWQIPRK
ncbi:MAG: sigma-54 dependent transcriptional regulator [Nitrospirae bacterium]|nr:sigma-54 dependent transcriptional regulator [Nitrospirota bacterium]MCL5421356.1 sigma-54 dependent transcriptional regulator [Nitrospirota bacterium]